MYLITSNAGYFLLQLCVILLSLFRSFAQYFMLYLTRYHLIHSEDLFIYLNLWGYIWSKHVFPRLILLLLLTYTIVFNFTL